MKDEKILELLTDVLMYTRDWGDANPLQPIDNHFAKKEYHRIMDKINKEKEKLKFGLVGKK